MPADAEQQVEDEVARSRSERNDVEAVRVDVHLACGRDKVQEQRRRGFQQRPEAVDGADNLAAALLEVHVVEAHVDEYEQDDQCEYRADEPQRSSSFPPQPAARFFARASSGPLSSPSILDLSRALGSLPVLFLGLP